MVYVVRRIEQLSLQVAAEKTDAVLFYGRRRPERLTPFVRIKGELIKVSPHMKYLGVMVDSKLNFKAHFDHIGDKVVKVTRALGRLMSNLSGPHERKRRLYAGTLSSVILYVAPI